MPSADDSTSAPTATSTKKGFGIIEASDDRNLDRPSPSTSKRPRGDPSELSEADADSPVRQSGDSGDAGGDPPSKQAEAGPAADRADADSHHSAVAESRGRPLRQQQQTTEDISSRRYCWSHSQQDWDWDS